MTRGSSVSECFATPMTSYSFPLKWRYTPGVISRSMLGRLPFKRKQARQIAWPVTYLAEEVGFEPTEPCGSTVFKTAAFNHSAIPPVRPDYIRCLIDAAPSVGILQVSFGRLRPGGASSCASRPCGLRPRRRPRLCAPAPKRLALASPEQFIAVQYVRSANFALRG